MNNNELPIGWKIVELENILEQLFAGGDRPEKVSTERTAEFNFPIYANGIKNKGLYGFTNEYKVDKECVTISARGTIGYSVVRTEKFVPIVRLIVIIPTEYTLSQYLKFYLESQVITDSGSSIPQLTIPMVKNFSIPLSPLNEQKRIVTKIEKLFLTLENSDKYLLHLEKQLKRYRKSVLKSAFEGELTREWRDQQTDLESAEELLEKIKDERIEYIKQEIKEKFEDKTEKWIADKAKKETNKFYKSIKDIEDKVIVPKRWEWTRLNLFTNMIMGQSPESSTYNNNEEGLPFFQGSADFTGLHPNIKVWCTAPKKIVGKDYILFSVRAPVGDINISSCVSSIGRGLAGIKGFGGISNKFLYFLLKNSVELIKLHGKGSTFDAIRADELKNISIALAPIKEQEEIVKQIEKHYSIIDKLESVVHKSIKESKRLRQSILKQAFEGKLVEQDSNDESADKLLKKIVKAKEEYKKEISKRKRK